MISGFTYVHNALDGGYPIKEVVKSLLPAVDEMVVVDCKSTDGTRELLESLPVRIIDGKWGTDAGETLKAAHTLHIKCKYETIIHAEADEVWDPKLLETVINYIEDGFRELSVYRLQVEINQQRIREYPVQVHRVFRRGTTEKYGRTTTAHSKAIPVPIEASFLWDLTNCFRDQWLGRINQNAKLWSDTPIYRHTPGHFLADPIVKDVQAFMKSEIWTRKTTPIDIPDILKPLVGVTDLKEYYGKSN